MIKKIALFLLLFSYSACGYANFWQAIGQCVADPCNCGDSNSDKYENWDGVRTYKGKRNHLCPPWNKETGRNDNTCLVKPPGIGSTLPLFPQTGYENICAESTPESTYFEPKIKVRSQMCNFLTCWTTSNSLGWNGECINLAGSYGVPLHRLCARIALPANPGKNIVQDPGYTNGLHLNFEGAPKADETIEDKDGNPVIIDVPKLCLYKDPSILDLGFDLMDSNIYNQPFHKTTTIHPVIQTLIGFLKFTRENPGLGGAMSFGDVIEEIGSDNSGEDIESEKARNELNYIAGNIDIIQPLVDVLEEFGQINRAVDSTEYGCVNIPLGPMPPPYCETVSAFSQAAILQKICPLDAGGSLVESTQDNECVVSTLTNNFIRNTVRVGYENLVPICRNGENPLTTDKCVNLENMGVINSARALHLSTGRLDIVKPCSTATPGALCVETMIPHRCSITANGCQDGFRLVYGTKNSNNTKPNSWFYDDMPDCSTGTSNACQEIWGINTGEFIDVSLAFPQVQVSGNIAPLVTNFSLENNKGNLVNFGSSIVRVASFNPVYSFTQHPNQICVFENDYVVGCTKREPFTQPKIYSCDNPPLAGLACSSSYFNPKIIASAQDGTDSTNIIVEPSSVYNSGGSSVINLAGYEFDSFVTDDNYIIKPFSGSKSINPGSIFGTYRDDILPFDGTNYNSDTLYLHGLEYINNAYHLGGKNVCLESTQLEKCPANTKMCVLANLDNANIVSCSSFIDKNSAYGGLNLCNSSHTNCQNVDAIPGKTGGAGITIKKCDGGKHCYSSPGDVQVCEVSSDTANRHTPSPSLGNVLTDDQYYDIDSLSGFGLNYDKDTYGLRDKTSFEMNLCTSIPQPECTASNDYSEENGFAAWTKATVEEKSTGSCQNGWEALTSPLKRYCVPFSDTRTIGFEPLYKIVSGNRVYDNRKCIKKKCAALSTFSAVDGYASWPETEFGQEATGTCNSGYSSLAPLTRNCIAMPDGSVSFEALGSNETCVKGKCNALTTFLEIDGYASWPETEFGQEATGTCKAGHSSSTPLKRNCILLADGSVTFDALASGETCIKGKCAALSSFSTVDGYASWPETELGKEATGTCKAGYESSTSLKRDCIVQANGTLAFDTLGSGETCVSKKCGSVYWPSSAEHGWATWTESEFEGESTGTCLPLLVPVTGTLQKRRCLLQPDGSTALEPVTDNHRCRTIFGF